MGILFSSGRTRAYQWRLEKPVKRTTDNNGVENSFSLFVTKLTRDLLNDTSPWERLARRLHAEVEFFPAELDFVLILARFVRDGEYLCDAELHTPEKPGNTYEVMFIFGDDPAEEMKEVKREFLDMIDNSYKHLNDQVDARNSAVALALVNKGANQDALDIVSAFHFGNSIRTFIPGQVMAPEEGRREYARVYSRTLREAVQQYN